MTFSRWWWKRHHFSFFPQDPGRTFQIEASIIRGGHSTTSEPDREECGRGRGEEDTRRPSTSRSLLLKLDKCECRIVQIVLTDLMRNLFRWLIFSPQRFIWINTQKILLCFVCGNKTLKGSKTFCVGRTVLHVRKHSRDSEEYQSNLFVLAHFYLFCPCLWILLIKGVTWHFHLRTT